MAFDPSKSILRNNEGDPIPQIWDDEQQEFIPDEGKQIGSIVERSIIMDRQIRASGNHEEIITVPPRARGYIASLGIYGVTGTFDSGQGIRILNSQFALGGSAGSQNAVDLATEFSTSVRPHILYCYPAIALGDAVPSPGREVTIAGLPIMGDIRFRIAITGSFSADEGFDCELGVAWLL